MVMWLTGVVFLCYLESYTQGLKQIETTLRMGILPKLSTLPLHPYSNDYNSFLKYNYFIDQQEKDNHGKPENDGI